LDQVVEPAREAERLYRADAQDDPSGNYFARLGVTSARLVALLLSAQYGELSTQLHNLVDDAVAHDNRFLLIQLTYVQTQLEQVTGKGSASRSRIAAQRSVLPEGCFGVLHVLHMGAELTNACWTGDHASVRELVDTAWSKFLQSPVRRAATLAWVAYSEHARYVLNRYLSEGRRGDPFALVRKDVLALEKFLGLGQVFATQCRGRVAWLKADRREAIAQFRKSATILDELGMPHLCARDQYALGILLADAEGSRLRTAAERRMLDLGVVDLANDLRASYPELAEPA
jgi:hypothetical protein